MVPTAPLVNARISEILGSLMEEAANAKMDPVAVSTFEHVSMISLRRFQEYLDRTKSCTSFSISSAAIWRTCSLMSRAVEPRSMSSSLFCCILLLLFIYTCKRHKN